MTPSRSRMRPRRPVVVPMIKAYLTTPGHASTLTSATVHGSPSPIPLKGRAMKELLNYAKASPAAIKAFLGIESYVRGAGLEPALLELVEMRASQINGCAYCLDMHSKDARAAGESEQRLYALPAWREA